MNCQDGRESNEPQLVPQCVARADEALTQRRINLGCLPLNLVEEDEVEPAPLRGSDPP